MSITKNPDQEPGPEPTIRPTVPAVYAAIHAVLSDLSPMGISKDQRNVQQGYQFRGIDDILNTLSSLLAKHGLLILPRVISRETQERQTQKGGLIFYTVEKIEYDFIAVKDGSIYTTTIFGEAMDSADKSTNKAMSAAYKYNAIQAFAIPTKPEPGEHNDADATTPDPGQAKEKLRLAAAEAKFAAMKQEAAAKAAKPAAPAKVVKPAPWKGEIHEVIPRHGKDKDKKPYTYYDINFTDGRIARTYSETLASRAGSLLFDPAAGGPTVLAEVVPGRWEDSWKLVGVVEIQESEVAGDNNDDFVGEEHA